MTKCPCAHGNHLPLFFPPPPAPLYYTGDGDPETLNALFKLIGQLTATWSAATEPQPTLPDTRPVAGLTFRMAMQTQQKQTVSMTWPIPRAHIPMTCLGRTSLVSYLWDPNVSLGLVHGLKTCQSEIPHLPAMCPVRLKFLQVFPNSTHS